MTAIPQPYTNDDKECFAYTSVNERWPAILTGVVKDLIQAAESASGEARDEATTIAADVKKFISEIDADVELLPLAEDQAFSAKNMHWKSAPWLYSECYLYRKTQLFFDNSKHWKKYDMFRQSKEQAFFKSAEAVATLADRYIQVEKQVTTQLRADELALKVLFHELLNTALWGNATDLSLLVTVSLEELKKLQVAAEDRDKESVLAQDFEAVWKQMWETKGGRVDFVLDNAGFELYTDLILALFLLDTGLAEQVVLHPKSQPWFVSDVVPGDWAHLLDMLQNSSKFPKNPEAIHAVVKRLEQVQNEGQLLLRPNKFWTTPLPYWEIHEGGSDGGDSVWRDLRASKLVIFKGDLNYRKLTGDIAWPRDTPFKSAIRELADANINLLSLRTIKADVCVGLPTGKDKELEKKWAASHPGKPSGAWAWSGNYAVIEASLKNN